MDKIIAIDGPSGSGKSTLAKNLAKELGWIYLDTGAMYRSVSFVCLESNVPATDLEGVLSILQEIVIEFKNTAGGQKVFANGQDVTDAIRTKKVTAAVSAYSAVVAVREKITNLIRDIGKAGNAVLDGRDIGTVVFPEAQVKLFLLASAKVRAQRRIEEMKEEATLEEIIASIERRDKLDSERENAPLCKAKDAVEINTAGNTIEETTKQALKVCRDRLCE